MDESRITTVIVDTSAFYIADSDFLGINSELLPSFFAALAEKNILLLTHPVLDGEIQKHIPDSPLVGTQNKIARLLSNNENLLKYAGCYDEELINKIKAVDIKDGLYKKYLDIYGNAEILKYPNWESVFAKYFNAIPPFSETGKKKREFPDAVIIESVKMYMDEHVNDILLVVSSDNDWKAAFDNYENVQVVDSIENAIKLVNAVDCVLSKEMMEEIFDASCEEIKTKLESILEGESYDVSEYEFEEEFEMESVKISDIGDTFVPLKISRDQILIQIEADIQVSGSGLIIDEDRSYWDREESCYCVMELANLRVKTAGATVKAEILIKFDFDNPSDIDVVKAKLINNWNIDLDLKDYDICPLFRDDDKYDQYDALEGHLPN